VVALDQEEYSPDISNRPWANSFEAELRINGTEDLGLDYCYLCQTYTTHEQPRSVSLIRWRTAYCQMCQKIDNFLVVHSKQTCRLWFWFWQRLYELSGAMEPRSTGANVAIGRALEILSLQMRQQAPGPGEGSFERRGREYVLNFDAVELLPAVVAVLRGDHFFSSGVKTTTSSDANAH
jgi:hypothetical protein